MSLDVALQSVAFYVLSCSTCAKINHRRKAKVQAKKERAEKHELETEQPGLYRHPSPFSTNPYWTEEIMMGPGPPKQKDKSGSKNASQRALNTAGQGSSYAGSSAMSSEPPSSPTADTEGSRLSGDGWNRKRYQREDEALWGHDVPGPGQRIMDAIAKAGSQAGRLLEGRLSKGGSGKEEENPGTYYLARNPPVNDLHPPVVSTAPSSRDETRWMLQPPPPAKIMEGKERVNRSRAGSDLSRKGGEGTPLSRQVTERLVDAKLQRGETPTFLEVRSSTSRAESRSKTPTSTRPKAQGDGGSRSSSLGSSGSEVPRRKRIPPPISVSTSARSSRDTVEHVLIPSTPPMTASIKIEQPSRPVLTTILSSSNAVPQTVDERNKFPALRELSAPFTNSANTRSPSPSHRLPPNANAMPASIPSVDTNFPGLATFKFPAPIATENTDPVDPTT
ncbi:hypothetical protein L207DRAFT_415004 [Hyaloscypha variabilis F]|uniref:Signal peptide-containing protein n=1 Tax=Hyaloscypha variabilis (strain UAMH 11265 / GT02V1 / F) TaxID=1149755 RepID=A0A2J6SCZ6_HYAVF|nr:hypothetical protein L207DRAFT_415004 [Hyaloscypha variabilis F]